jgi:hypothetical protein
MHANEQDFRLLFHQDPFRLSQCPEPLPREPVREHRDEDIDPSATEQIERLGDVPLNRRLRIDAFELIGEPFGRLTNVMCGDGVARSGSSLAPRY